MNKIIFLTIILANNVVLAQDPNWQTTGNNILGSRWIGTNNPFPFRIYTNGTHKASFTYDGTEYADGSSGPGNGLRIFNQTNNSNPIGVLDLLTSGQNKTHVGFGRNGSITGAGIGNRMEYYAAGLGFWFNAQGGRSIWTINGTENARMGANSYWRFGANGSSSDAARRVEIVDGNQQLRLKQSTGGGFAEFYVRPNGRLLITPSGDNTGFTAINNLTYNPTERIDVDGTARFRNVPTAIPDALFVGEQVTGLNDLNVRRLDFTGNANDVLQGNGTWGTGASPINANNGITLTSADEIQIGEVYNAAQTVPLLNNREVRMNNKHFVFSRRNIGNTGKVGIGLIFPSMPSQRLDVDGNARLRTLPLAVNQASASVNKIVMVDSTGALRWSNFGPSTFGTICSDTVNSIFTEHRKVNLNDNNFYFEGNSDTTENNNVGFGWACGTPLKAKVDAIQYGEGGIGGSFMVFENWQNGINNMNPTGVIGVANGNGNGGAGYVGVNGIALGSNSAYCYGIYGSAGNSAINRAGFFNGDVEIINGFLTSDQQFKTNTTAIPSALKIVSSLNPKTYYFDTLNFQQFNFGSEKQYGFIAQEAETVLPELVHNSIHPGEQDVFGNVIGQSTTYKSLNYNAIIPINTQAIKELNSKVDKSTLSDQTIKTNVADLSGSLEKVLDMRGVTYDWDGSSHPNLVLDSVSHVGFIAQEIYAIDPLLTFVDEDTLMHVEYDKIVPILAEAISELNETVVAQDSIIEVLEDENLAQQTEIDDLNDRLTQLENCLSGILPFLCQMNNSSIQPTQEIVQEQLRAAINVNLSDRNSIILNQNVPNPFAESTTITFSIPTSVQKAQIHFYDGQGKLINSVDIIERGNGQLNVFANDLSTGVYTYSLVADGQIVSTKRMVKE